MALPPPPGPKNPPSKPGGKKRPPKKKRQTGGSSAASSGGGGNQNKDPWVIFKNGKISYSFNDQPPSNALKVFGLPAKRSDFKQARSHYNDLFRAWLGRRAREGEVAKILQSGVSDYALRLQLVQKGGFTRSPMFKTIRAQAGDILGFNYKITRREILQAMKAEGGISEASLRAALANSQRARTAVRHSYFQTSGKDIQYLAGAFGPGELNLKQREALALQESGLRQSTMGAKLQGELDKAVKRMERIFSGTLAQPNLTLGPGGLQATSLQPRQEPDLPA